jgi:hypothetical protein
MHLHHEGASLARFAVQIVDLQQAAGSGGGSDQVDNLDARIGTADLDPQAAG